LLLDVIRHGLTPSNLGHRYNDHEHEPLAPEAVATLASLAFEASSYDRIDVSHLRRAVETAERLGLSAFTLEPRLAERGLGVLQGLTPDACHARFGADYAAFLRFDADYCVPEGESRGAHLARIKAWLADVSASDARHALAITHGGTLDFLRRIALDLPEHGDPFDGGANLARSRFELTDGRLTLIAFAEPLR
jgi:broad specificity phosphatase PhoE